MFQIDITSLDPGVHRVERETDADALGLDPDRFEDIRVEAVVHYQPNRILVMFQARATAALTCDRTLQPFEQPIEGGYSVLFTAPQSGAPEESDDHDEVRDLSPGDRALDLTDLVRDTLLLAVPQRKIAPGAEGEELDTVFGAPTGEAGEPVDPRWEKLRELKSDHDDS